LTITAQLLQPKGKTGKADQALAFIQKLYAIEKQSKDEPPDEPYQIRQQARPIIAKLHVWLENRLPVTPLKTALGKAMRCLNNQWPRLIGYLESGDYSIDNNRAENAIHPFVIGRKNWLFSAS
jgi:transposase